MLTMLRWDFKSQTLATPKFTPSSYCMFAPAVSHRPTVQDVKGSLFLCIEVFPESFSSDVEHPLVTIVSSVSHYYRSHVRAECRSPCFNTSVLTVRPESYLQSLGLSPSLLIVRGSQEGLFNTNLIYIPLPLYLTNVRNGKWAPPYHPTHFPLISYQIRG